FDEIEKAHPDVFNLLLQILDDGRLTDSQGRVVNFKNTVIIMTSNIGSDILLEGANEEGELSEDVRERVMSLLRRGFRPEFLNRVDEIVLFKPLTRKEIRAIVGLVLESLSKRLEDRHIRIETTERALERMVEEGWSPVYGARPIRRYIQKIVETGLGRMIINGEIAEGDTALIDADGTGIVIKRKQE
ncbi:MAG TPA: AAA family ATPase, partial [Thermoclostridium caenicola]|nr:AAA family ATPase [Thermoclostridium caenicola]